MAAGSRLRYPAGASRFKPAAQNNGRCTISCAKIRSALDHCTNVFKNTEGEHVLNVNGCARQCPVDQPRNDLEEVMLNRSTLIFLNILSIHSCDWFPEGRRKPQSN